LSSSGDERKPLRRTPIRRKEARRIIEGASELGVEVLLDRFELAEIVEREDRVLLIDRRPVLVMKSTGEIVPHVEAYDGRVRCSRVKVDEGAVPFIKGGADVMAPGVVSFEEFDKGDVVAVVDLKDRVISSGIAMVSSTEMAGVRKGKVIRTVHSVGDAVHKLTDLL